MGSPPGPPAAPSHAAAAALGPRLDRRPPIPLEARTTGPDRGRAFHSSAEPERVRNPIDPPSWERSAFVAAIA